MSSASSVHEAGTMRMEVIELGGGEEADVAAPEGGEGAALLVAGELETESDRAARSSPFDPPLAGWYLPVGSSLRVGAVAPSALVLATSTGAGLTAEGAETAVFVERAEGEVRGRDEWERTVTTLIDPAGCGSQRLIAGQTVHASGGWSSYPPHRHDGSGDEPYFEEIYHYRFDPPAGFGFQGLYADDGLSEAHLIRDGDTLTIPRGYHPVCAAPGYRFTYFWSLCGPAGEFQQVDDLAHAWLSSGG